MTTATTVRAARKAAGLSARQAAELVGVTTVTWQRWEGKTSRQTTIPAACWELFLSRQAASLTRKESAHIAAVAIDPGAWMPWNYTQALATAESGPAAN